MNDIETENQKLRETLDEYNKEFADVKNQGNAKTPSCHSNLHMTFLDLLNQNGHVCNYVFSSYSFTKGLVPVHDSD